MGMMSPMMMQNPANNSEGDPWSQWTALMQMQTHMAQQMLIMQRNMGQQHADEMPSGFKLLGGADRVKNLANWRPRAPPNINSTSVSIGGSSGTVPDGGVGAPGNCDVSQEDGDGTPNDGDKQMNGFAERVEDEQAAAPTAGTGAGATPLDKLKNALMLNAAATPKGVAKSKGKQPPKHTTLKNHLKGKDATNDATKAVWAPIRRRSTKSIFALQGGVFCIFHACVCMYDIQTHVRSHAHTIFCDAHICAPKHIRYFETCYYRTHGCANPFVGWRSSSCYEETCRSRHGTEAPCCKRSGISPSPWYVIAIVTIIVAHGPMGVTFARK